MHAARPLLSLCKSAAANTPPPPRRTYAPAWPEREVCEACVRQLECPSVSPGVRELLAPLVSLFAAAAVERDLAWFLGQEVVPPKVCALRPRGT